MDLSVLKLEFKPRRILLDPTSVCNLRCAHCHNATGLAPTYYIDMKRIDELVELSKKEPNMLVNLTGKGDILCHPDWREMLNRLDQCNDLTSMFYTNALLFKDDDIDFCWNLKNLKLIHVSIDAANEKSYRNIRGADFEKLKTILSLLGSHPKKKAIRISMTIMKENVDQMKDFVDLAVEMGVQIASFQAIFDRHYTPIRTPSGFSFDRNQVLFSSEIEDRIIEAAEYSKKKRIFIDTEQLEYLKEKHPIIYWHKHAIKEWMRKVLKVNSFYIRPESKQLVNSFPNTPACLRPWGELSHVEEGWKVCCMQFPTTSLGGKDASLDEAWNSPKMQRIREQLLNYECPPECDPAHCRIAKNLQEG